MNGLSLVIGIFMVSGNAFDFWGLFGKMSRRKRALICTVGLVLFGIVTWTAI